MHLKRPLSQAFSRALRPQRILKHHNHLRNHRQLSRFISTTSTNMSLFPRGFYASDPNFTSLFRLLDDFDTYNREVQGGKEGGRNTRQLARTFNPKFDVRETETAYELHGELPGIDRENVTMEFTDPQTVVIRGRVERTYSSGNLPSTNASAITEKGEDHASAHKVTVEDEAAEEAKERGNNGTQVAKHQNGHVEQQQQRKGPVEKYWVSERSVGEFSRTFSFPTRVDQDTVTANLKDGILSVVVPKAKKNETRRIAIN